MVAVVVVDKSGVRSPESLTLRTFRAMRDETCVDFLQWCLPRLRKRWAGFRKVRGQVCKRIDRRFRELGLAGPDAYRAYLETHSEEWAVLDGLCRVTISRFYRDRGVFDALGEEVLPVLAETAQARGDPVLRCWSAGCASGEEVYTLRILWDLRLRPQYSDLPLRITATDAGAHMLVRAERGCYGRGTLKEVPSSWLEEAFTPSGEELCVRQAYRSGLTWLQQDLRTEMPEGPFHLVLCRNLVFTYFDETLQRACLARILERLHPGGALVLGKHERLPEEAAGAAPWAAHRRIYRRATHSP